MSIHQSNIAMLRALHRSFTGKAKASAPGDNGDLMGRMAIGFREAADDLERQETALRDSAG